MFVIYSYSIENVRTIPVTILRNEFFPELRQERLQTLIETVFPGRVTGEFRTDLANLEQYINDSPDAFIEDIRTLGRTPDTEALLTTVFPDITSTDLTEIFGAETLDLTPIGITEQRERVVKGIGSGVTTGFLPLSWIGRGSIISGRRRGPIG